MLKLLARAVLRFPLTAPLLVVGLFCLITSAVFLCYRPPANVSPRSGYALLYTDEWHAAVPDAGVWLAFVPTGAPEVICQNGARVPLARDAWLVLEPADLSFTPISGLSADDFPFYRCDTESQLIRCRDGRIIRLPSSLQQ